MGGGAWLSVLKLTYMPDTRVTLKTCWTLEEGFPMETLRALSML